MRTTAEKSAKTTSLVQQRAGQASFFRKAGEESFFRAESKSSFFSTSIQPKLSVSSPDDPQEKEADAVAEKVMRMTEPPSVPATIENEEKLQRKEEEEELQAKPEPFVHPIQRMEEDEQVQAKFDSTIFRSADDDHNREEEAALPVDDQPAIHRKSISLYHSDVIQRSGRGPPISSPRFSDSLTSSKGSGSPLPTTTRTAMESRFGADFSNVRIHSDSQAAHLSRDVHAQAFTHQNHIYFNSGKFNPHTAEGGTLLAHELAHTIQQGTASALHTKREAGTTHLSTIIHRKETDSLVRPELARAVHIAKMESGLVNSKLKDAEGKRVGWRRLLDYFNTAMGPEQILAEGRPYQVGKVSEESIVYHREAKGVQVVNPTTGQTEKGNRDALPSWCGIFVFWALKKGGVPMPLWKLGQPILPPKSAYPPRYVPKKGDIAYKGPPYMHYGLVDSSEPHINKTSEITKVQVTTVNGNTAGSDNLGGQVAVSTDPIGAWSEKGGFFNPLYGKESQMPAHPEPFAEPTQTSTATAGEVATGASPPLPVAVITDGIAVTVQPDIPAPKTEVVPAPDNATETATLPVQGLVPAAPASPAEDPAFQQVIANSGAATKKQKAHGDPQAKADAAQLASVVPEELDKNSQAQKNQVGAMAQQKAGKFDAETFKAQLMQRVVEALPKDDNETVDMYEDKTETHERMEGAKTAAKGDVKATKDAAANAIASTAEAVPDTEHGVKLKETKAMETEEPGKAPYVPDAKAAAPKPKTDEELSMENEAQSLDNELDKNNVTEAQLNRSNEPEFVAAADTKQQAQTELRKTPEDFRKEEQPQLATAEQQAEANVAGKLAQMHGVRTDMLGTVDSKKDKTKKDDEEQRLKVANDLQTIYNETKTKVETILNDLESTVNSIFDFNAKLANDMFESNVDRRLSDHYGITTIDDKVEDWARGSLSPEIDRIFREERQRYIDYMDGAITNISKIVEAKLTEAMNEIAAGRKNADDYWNGLPAQTQKLNAETKDDIESQFGQLEQMVQDKHDELVNKLADKYVKNVKDLKEKFEKIKESKQGWLSAAFNAIAGVIKTILELKDMLLNTLRRIAHVIGDIIDDPIGFLGNLVDAVKMGLNNFVDRIDVHLREGFFTWLMGNMPPGIVFPDKWDLSGIFHFVMQILGLTWANIRQRAVDKLGEPVVAALEEVFEIFQIIRKEGLAGLWRYIEKKVGDIKAMVIDAIQDMLITEVIKAGIVFVISLLNPVGAFIKACKAIYEIVMFFINNGKKILEFVNTVIDSISLIVAGSLQGAAKMVEDALARLVPIAIGFLASLLGLSGISEKAQKIIKAIQAPINRAIDWVLDQAIALSKALGLDKAIKKVQGSVQKGKDWAREKVEQVKDKGKAAVEKAVNWFRKKKEVSTADGERHTLYFEGKDDNFHLMIRSVPVTYKAFIRNALKQNGITAPAAGSPEQQALTKAEEIDKKLDGYGKVKQADRVVWGEQLAALLDELATLTAKLNINWDVPNPPSVIRWGTPNSDGFGTMMSAELLSENYIKGEPAEVESKAVMGWDYARSFQAISKKGAPTPIYVKGHLLNENMGGLANVTNLTPITNDMNKDHLNRVERHVKKLVLGKESKSDKTPTPKKVVNYAVNVNYTKHPRRTSLVSTYADTMWQVRKASAEERRRPSPDATKLAQYKATDEAAMNILALLTYEENSLTTGFDCQWEQLQYNAATKKWEPVPGTMQSVPVPHTLPSSVEHYKPVFDTFKTDIP